MSTVSAARSLVATVQPLLPGRGDHRGLPRSWARDLAAGVTVGIVALPLALSAALPWLHRALPASLLAAVGTLAPLLARGHVFTTLADAVAHACQHVARTDHAGSDHDPGAAVDG